MNVFPSRLQVSVVTTVAATSQTTNTSTTQDTLHQRPSSQPFSSGYTLILHRWIHCAWWNHSPASQLRNFLSGTRREFQRRSHINRTATTSNSLSFTAWSGSITERADVSSSFRIFLTPCRLTICDKQKNQVFQASSKTLLALSDTFFTPSRSSRFSSRPQDEETFSCSRWAVRATRLSQHGVD